MKLTSHTHCYQVHLGHHESVCGCLCSWMQRDEKAQAQWCIREAPEATRTDSSREEAAATLTHPSTQGALRSRYQIGSVVLRGNTWPADEGCIATMAHHPQHIHQLLGIHNLKNCTEVEHSEDERSLVITSWNCQRSIPLFQERIIRIFFQHPIPSLIDTL